MCVKNVRLHLRVVVALAVVVGLSLVIEHLEAVLWVRLVVDHLVLAVRVHKRVPALHVAVAVGNLVTLLRVLVVARGEAKLVALGPVETLYEVNIYKLHVCVDVFLRPISWMRADAINSFENLVKLLTCSWY